MFQTIVLDKIKTHILCSVTFFENHAIYELMWKNTVEQGRSQISKWYIAFPLQQWLRKCASVLRYKYIASLRCFRFI